MIITEKIWRSVAKGSTWKSLKTGRRCRVVREPISAHDTVVLIHQSGRISTKQLHYFLYDFEKVKP